MPAGTLALSYWYIPWGRVLVNFQTGWIPGGNGVRLDSAIRHAGGRSGNQPDSGRLHQAVGPHAQLIRSERLGDKIVRAVSKAAGERLLAAIGGANDHPCFSPTPLSPPGVPPILSAPHPHTRIPGYHIL